MTLRAVLVPALLRFIIQVALTPCVLGSDGQWHGSSSAILEQILLKRSIPIQGLSKLNTFPELVDFDLRATLNEITASWSLKDPTRFPDVRFHVTTAGVDEIVSQTSYNISGLACDTSYNVKVSPVDASGADYGLSTSATIKTKGVPELFNLTLRQTIKEISARWSLKDQKCFPDVRFRVTTAGVDKIVSQTSYNISGLACNTSYYVKVSPVDAFGAPNGVSTNATIITKGVPELVNLALRATLYKITASWSMKDPNCFSDLRYRVTTAGVDIIVSQNSCNISGLACNTSYNVKVTPVDVGGAPYGVSTNASIITKGVPELFNLTLQETFKQITASWSLNDQKCFPNVRFRVTTAGVDKIVTQNSFNISAPACNTSYFVKVSPVDAFGAPNGVSTNATIIMKGVPELVNLALQATLHDITASWSLKEPKCFPAVRFRVTTAGVDKIVSQNSYNISGLACNISYYVKVSPVDAGGAPYGVSTNASIITKGVPELVNLTLQETLKVTTARWSQRDPKCFPNVRFRITTAGVDAIVSQNSYNISGLACNTSYYVKVSPVDANDVTYGGSTNATIIAKGVPRMSRYEIQSTLTVITGSWSLRDPKCFPDVRFRVTTAGVDKIVSQNSFEIRGLVCSTSYYVEISPIDAGGATCGDSASATVMTQGVPELVNLTLQETLNGITARWSLKDPKCSPDVRFRVTTAGVDKFVSLNSFNFSGLVCDTSYNIKVSPVKASGSSYGVSTEATIITNGGVQLNLIAMVARSLVVRWAPLQDPCKNFSGYEVSLSLPNGAYKMKNITQKNYIVFAGLSDSTTYQVRVQLLDFNGRLIGRGVMAQQTTISGATPSGRCPFPTLKLTFWSSYVVCAGVEKPTPSTNLQANIVCYNKHPPTREVNYAANLYLAAPGWVKYEALQEYLRMFDYTEELLVNGYYKNGAWVWGFGTMYNETFKIDPALLVGLPAGGDGPDDYKMLYADPKKDFRLSVAKEGRSFGGMICAFPLKF